MVWVWQVEAVHDRQLDTNQTESRTFRGSGKNRPNPMPQQLSDQSWIGVLSLSELDGFEELTSSMSHFRDWLENPPTVLSALPAPWDMSTPWQQLLITKALRPDLLEKVKWFHVFPSRRLLYFAAIALSHATLMIESLCRRCSGS